MRSRCPSSRGCSPDRTLTYPPETEGGESPRFTLRLDDLEQVLVDPNL
jgi:hypothetical protein